MTSSGKVRIYELSRDLGLENKDVLDAADLIGGGLYDGGFYLPVASSGDRHSPRS